MRIKRSTQQVPVAFAFSLAASTSAATRASSAASFSARVLRRDARRHHHRHHRHQPHRRQLHGQAWSLRFSCSVHAHAPSGGPPLRTQRSSAGTHVPCASRAPCVHASLGRSPARTERSGTVGARVIPALLVHHSPEVGVYQRYYSLSARPAALLPPRGPRALGPTAAARDAARAGRSHQRRRGRPRPTVA